MTTHQEALLPCPFCGGKDSPKLKLWDGTPPIPGFYVVCDAAGWEGMEGRGCGCSGAYGEDKNEAIAAWNRRLTTLAPSDNGLVERLRAYGGDNRNDYRHQAAALITAQAAEITGLREVVEVCEDSIAKLERKVQHWQERAASLEALLDKAVEALEFYEGPFEYVKSRGLDESTPDFYDELDTGWRARSTLTAIQEARHAGR